MAHYCFVAVVVVVFVVVFIVVFVVAVVVAAAVAAVIITSNEQTALNNSKTGLMSQVSGACRRVSDLS